MRDDNGLASRWRDFRRHPAVQAAAVYAGASWALIQVADIFFPSLGVVRWLGIILVAGFLPVVGGAWWLASREALDGAATAAAEGELADASSPVRRRRRRYAYAAAVGLLAVGGLFWWVRPSILGAVNPDAQVIAVLPFHASGLGSEELGEGMVDLLSPSLDGVGGIRTVNSSTVLHRWQQRAVDGSLDLEGSLAVGRDVDAGSVLLGSVVSAGSGVRMTAQLYSVRGVELAHARVEGPAEDVLALVDSLGLNLLRDIWLAHEPVPNLRVSGITTGNVDAIRAYLRGQQHYRRSQWDSALVAFQQAVERDSTFALAHYRLGLTYGWSLKHGGFGSAGAQRHGRLALRYSDRLPPRERTLVAAHSLFEEGKLAAHDTLVRYVARYPDDPEGWYMLADVRFHAMPLLALDYEDIFGPFDRVLELDPSLAPAIIHPLELSLMFADSARFHRYLAAMEGAAEPAMVEPWKLLGQVFEQPESVVAILGTLPDGERYGGLLLIGTYHSPDLNPKTLLPGFAAAESATDANGRIQLLSIRAMVLASLGRLSEAQPIRDTLWAIAPNRQEAFQSLIPVYAGYADSTFAARALAALENPPPVPGVDQLFSYSRMIYALSRGRSAEARRLAERALAADTSFYPELLPPLVRAGLGWADILDGDTVGGLGRIEAGLGEAGYVSGTAMAFSQQLRFALAAIQASRSETRAEGIRRLRYGRWVGDIVYFPLAYLALGRALEDSGDPAGAAEAYADFIRLWQDADPELQPRVETARRALERLSAENAN